MTFLYFIISLLFVIALVIVRSIRIAASPISSFELRRRAEQHEVEAVLARERNAKLPDLLALRYIVDIVLTSLLLGVLVYFWGFLVGVAAGLLLMLVIPKLSSLPFVGRQAHKLFDKREEGLLAFAHKRHNQLKLFRQPSVSPQTTPVHSRHELLHFAKQAKHLFTADQLSLLEGGLFFADKKVRDVMTPVAEVKYIGQDDVMGPVVLDDLHKSGHSIFPVIKKDINHVVGMLHMRDLDALPRQLTTVKRYMEPDVYYIRDDAVLEQVLHGFLHSHRHLFIVINELRETVGVISLQDVTAALFGRTLTGDTTQYDDIREIAGHHLMKNEPVNTNEHEDI